MNDIELILPQAQEQEHEFGGNLERRVLWINEEIEQSTLQVVDHILQWNREDAVLPPDERLPIRLLFHSPGGDLDIRSILVSVIELSQTPVWGVAIGCVASAASLIYLACHRRLALESGYFVLHKGECSVAGGHDAVISMLKDYQNSIEKVTQTYISKTKLTEAEVRAKLPGEWYVRLPEALEKGLVQHMVDDISILL